MADQDRNEQYSKIRAWLEFPWEQSPSPHQILNQMLTDEQWLGVRLSNTEQAWNLVSVITDTITGQSEYTIAQPVSLSQNSGKVYSVHRLTKDEDNPYVPIDFDDYSSMDYGKMPSGNTVNAFLLTPEKVSFYRSGGQEQGILMVIQPTPQEVLSYLVAFHTGSVDRSAALMTLRSQVAELTDYLNLKSARHLVRYCKWSDDDARNEARRSGIAKDLEFQLAAYEPVVNRYIKRVNGSRSFEMSGWNDL